LQETAASAATGGTSVVNRTISSSATARGSTSKTAGTISWRIGIGCRRVSSSASPSEPNLAFTSAFISALAIARR
jgi:hypothetical protein